MAVRKEARFSCRQLFPRSSRMDNAEDNID